MLIVTDSGFLLFIRTCTCKYFPFCILTFQMWDVLPEFFFFFVPFLQTSLFIVNCMQFKFVQEMVFCNSFFLHIQKDLK